MRRLALTVSLFAFLLFIGAGCAQPKPKNEPTDTSAVKKEQPSDTAAKKPAAKEKTSASVQIIAE